VRKEGGREGGKRKRARLGPAARCWMAENVTVDAPKLNLPGNAERLIKCFRQGVGLPFAISPVLVF